MGKIKETMGKISKRTKRRIFFLVMILGLIVFLFPSVASAAGLADELYSKDISSLIKMISHIVYVFIWPCLVIAGTALDNSLIFGKFLHLDVALWNIWNIMKNFANFALGFLFIFAIVKNLFAGAFGGKEDPMKNAVDTVKSTLISGVLVQMSWFLVSVLIDLSTILIYAVGGLPLSMLDSYNKDVSRVPLLKMNAEITDDDSFFYYSYGDHNYSPCYLINKKGDANDNFILNLGSGYHQGEYIAGRRRLYLSEDKMFDTGYCTVAGYLYSYVESTGFFCDGEGGGEGDDGHICYTESGATLVEKNDSYHTQMKNYLTEAKQNTGDIESLVNSCFLMSAYTVNYVSASEGTGCAKLCSGYGEVDYAEDVFLENKFTLKDLLNKSKGWVGPFVTMYSSILNYQELVMNPDSYTVSGNLFGFILNTFFALILFIPMAILAVLLVIRIGYLWVVVAISPILVLVWFGPLKDKLKNNELLKKFEIKEVFTKIFSPVIVVFAVSLCIVFLSTIFKTEPQYKDASTTLSAFGIECVPVQDNNVGDNSCNVTETTGQNKNCDYSILGLVTIRLNAQNYNHGKNMFVWVLMMLVATGIVRFFMKFAIGMMGKKGEELMKTAEKFVTTLPILKLPGMDERVGLHAIGIGEGNSDKLINNLDSKVLQLTGANDQIQQLENRFGLNKDKSKDNSKSVSEAVKYIRENKINDYSKLDKEYQDALATVGYNSGNFEALSGAITAENYGKLLETTPASGGSEGHTNSDAVMYTSAQLDVAVKSDDKRRKRASGMVAGAVQTSDGVFMVDLLDGKSNTANPSNQQYEIVDRDTYEKRHFGDNTKTIDQIDAATYNQNKNDIDAYLRELQEELNELKTITDKNEKDRSDEEKNKKLSLDKLGITQERLDNLNVKFGRSTKKSDEGQN